ncbi:MAG: energy transducer TonB [Opitutae bacterium]|nr:energy transducer TonB [Opitutae bacterium]
MKSIKLIVGAALLGGLLAAPTFAATNLDRYVDHYKVVRTDVPLPAKVVNPTDLPARYIGAVVNVTLTVDATGQPRDIALESPDAELANLLVPVVAQWRFTPAQKDGVPVAKRILLPLALGSKYQNPSLR